MTEHLGGPETDEKILSRHKRYVDAAASTTGRVFKIVLEPTLIGVGQVAYWEKSWQGQVVWECGWGILPEYQGEGFATRALALLVAKARSEAKHQFLHAFPSVANAPSNALCKKLGFSRIDECELEYPPGKFMRCNDWRLDLFARAILRL